MENVDGSAVTPDCKTATDGKYTDKKCKNCTYTETGATIPYSHNFVGGVCSNCNAIQTVSHDSSHSGELSGYLYDNNTHWVECRKTNCTAAMLHTKLNEVRHNFDAEGNCNTCDYKCNHNGNTFIDKDGTQKVATCVEDGKLPDKYCPLCGHVASEGTVIKASPAYHNFDPDTGRCTNTGCSAVNEERSYTLILDPNDGTVSTGTSLSLSVTKNRPVPKLPTPVRSGYNFLGWFYDGDASKPVYTGQTFTYDSNKTAVARWSNKTQVLTVRRVFNGNLSTAKTIYTANVAEGTQLLGYLSTNVAGKVKDEQDVNPGYAWDKLWRDFSGNQSLTGQEIIMDQAQTVYVNLVSSTYTLYFNANGGTVTPETKTVSFNSAIGTLPTPYKEGSVFMGWKDASNNFVNANTVYKVASDSSLTAVWQDEALVILYIYINGDFSTCNRMIVMDGYVRNNNISRSDVFAEVAKYYAPASGTLKIAGLFDEYAWGSYRTNTSKAGTENVEVGSGHLNKVYVMVSNAKTGVDVIPTTPTNPTVPANGFWVRDLNGNLVWYPAGSSLPSGSGYWILDANGNPNIWVITSGSIIPTYIYTGSNPKTGDTAQIEIAAAVMVLAAAALITVMALRKNKSV